MMRTLGLIGVLALAGCSGPTELVVVTDSDLAVPTEVDEVVLHIAGPSGDQHARRAAMTGAGAPRFPVTAVLLYEGGALGPVAIRVLGRRGGAEVVHQDAIAWFVPGRSVAVPIELGSACGGSCPADATCADGECAPAQSELDAGTDPEERRRGRGGGHGRWSDDGDHDDHKDDHEGDDHEDDHDHDHDHEDEDDD